MELRETRDKRPAVILALLLLGNNDSFSSQSNDLFDLSLEQLLDTPVSLTANNPASTRKFAGVVTLITSDQIKKSGARDLLDLLKTVPGFWVHSDISSIQTLSFHGIYSYEGKVLLLIDDIEVNELEFGGTHFGNHYPAELIESVEIIHGPGSVIYGGTAEMAVIRVNTVKSEPGKTSAQWRMQLTDEGTVDHNLSLSHGFEIADWNMHLNLFQGNDVLSESDYVSLNGDQFSLDGNSDSKTQQLSLSAANQHWHIQVLYDSFAFDDRTFFGDVGLLIPPDFTLLEDNLHVKFENFAIQIKHDITLNDRWSLSAQLGYQKDDPWQTRYPDGRRAEFNAKRSSFTLNSTYNFSEDSSLLFGIDWYRDAARIGSSDGVFYDDAETYFSGRDSVSYTD